MAVKTNYSVNGKDYFRVSCTVGKDNNGKLIRKYFYGKSKKEAESKKNEYLNNIQNGLVNNFDKLELSNMIYTWLWDVMYVKLKPGTFERYEGVYRLYIENTSIGSYKLNDIKPLDIQRYYNALAQEGKTHSQIYYINRVIKAFFNYAIDNDMILKNPCSGSKVIIPVEEEKKEIEIFDNEDISKILKAENSTIKFLALTSVSTGMRRGEVIGLTWDAIDYINNEIEINKTIKTVAIFDDNKNKKWLPQFQTPKTKGSIRRIPLNASTKNIFEEIKTTQRIIKLKCGTSYEDNNLIFCREDGRMIDDKKIQRIWASFCKKNNIPYKNFHALRHTYATIQFENNVPLKTVSTLLGHSDIRITANTYTHVLKKHKEVAVDVLSGVLKN